MFAVMPGLYVFLKVGKAALLTTRWRMELYLTSSGKEQVYGQAMNLEKRRYNTLNWLRQWRTHKEDVCMWVIQNHHAGQSAPRSLTHASFVLSQFISFICYNNILLKCTSFKLSNSRILSSSLFSGQYRSKGYFLIKATYLLISKPIRQIYIVIVNKTLKI